MKRSADKLMRPTSLGMLAVLCSLLVSLRAADASCGDHLAMAHNQIQLLMSQQDELPPVPCHGPGCHRSPSVPIPVEIPNVASAFRQMFLPPQSMNFDGVTSAGVNVHGADALPLPGFSRRLERPPEQA